MLILGGSYLFCFIVPVVPKVEQLFKEKKESIRNQKEGDLEKCKILYMPPAHEYRASLFLTLVLNAERQTFLASPLLTEKSFMRSEVAPIFFLLFL